MADRTAPSDDAVGWHDTVDVICLGDSPGVLAYAICCDANDLDVLLVRPFREPDPRTVAWYADMTADLATGLNPQRESTPAVRAEFSLARVTPAPEPAGRREALEPFIGENLRTWSSHCLESPFGVLFTQVPELLAPMRVDDGESITAALVGTCADGGLASWLMDCARGVRQVESDMAAMVFDEGRVAGVELADGSMIEARHGLVLPAGMTNPPLADLPSPQGCVVAVVGRPAGRFARLDLLRP